MPFQSNAVLCRSAAKVLTLEKAKKILVFLSLNRTLPLCGEGTHTRKNQKRFWFFSRLIELCRCAAKVLTLGKTKKDFGFSLA